MHWDAAVIDDDTARAILDEFYALPETVADGVEALADRFTQRGLQFAADAAVSSELGSAGR